MFKVITATVRMIQIIQILLFHFLLYINSSEGQKINFTVSKDVSDNIFLYYYQGPTSTDRTIIKLEDGLSLTSQKYFDVNSNTIFYFHGWGENATSSSAEAIVSACLQMKIRNIVALDYSRLTRNYNMLSYIAALRNVSSIGDAIGEFLTQYTPGKQSVDLIKLVSHSLGSQVMAQAARKYGVGKLPRLTGLDPAGPYYNFPFVKHLDKSDGKFVDIIHTDAGFFGDGRTIGHADFFPNRGSRVQPGCDDNLLHFFTFCSHNRSWRFYAESILNRTAFPAKKCDRTFFDFSHCCCNSSSLAYMGYYVNTSIRGTYFLQTNSTSPYGEGKKGLDFN